MTIIFAILATLWWLSIWGIFEILTDKYTNDEKMKLYLLMIGVIIVVICFFPKVINHL